MKLRARASVGTLKCEVYFGEMFKFGNATEVENRNTVHLCEVKIESYPLIEESTSGNAIHNELIMPQIAIKFVNGSFSHCSLS